MMTDKDMIKLEQIKNIALFRLSALGDVTMAVPLVRTLQRACPQASITWIAGKGVYPFLKGLSGVDFIVIDKPKSLSAYKKLYQQLKPYRFDVLLAAQASLSANLVYPLIKAKLKIAYDWHRSKDGHWFFAPHHIERREEHTLESFLGFARALGIQETVLDADLPITEEDWQWARQQLSHQQGTWLAVNLAASTIERTWPIERTLAVIQKAKQQFACNIVLTGGPSSFERKLAEEITAQVGCLNCVGKTTMKQLAALLASVDVLLSPDTGPLHIASAMGTPVIGLYAVTPPQVSGPYFSQQWVVNQFPAAVRTLLNKDPNNAPLSTRVRDIRAMQLISVDEVMAKLQQFFNQRSD